MEVFLETPRLILRQFTAGDVDALVELDSDPEVMFWITGGIPTSPEDIAGDVLPAFLDYRRRPRGWGFFAAVEKSSGDFLGWFHLRPAPGHPNDEPELGYRLRRAAWGRGYATEGAEALIAKAFTDLGAAQVVAETMVVHAASRRVMQKCGMTVTRLFRQDWPFAIPGDEHGDVEYAITRARWESGRSG